MEIVINVKGHKATAITGPTYHTWADYDAAKKSENSCKLRDLYEDKLDLLLETVFRQSLKKPETYDLLYPICFYHDIEYRFLADPMVILVTSKWTNVLTWDNVDIQDNMVTQCFACGEMLQCATTQSCGKCRMATYCNKECQRQDWNAHKAKCKRSERCTRMRCSANSTKGAQGIAPIFYAGGDKEEEDKIATK
jgi:hypothetical protein